MIIASHGILASQLAGFDADAQAFFDRVTTAGGTLSATEQTAINKLVQDLKSYSIWSKMKAIYPMVGGGTGTTAARQAACSQNLKSSSFTGSFTSGWTYASTGVSGNGTSAYMDTNLNDNTELSLNSAHISIYSRTNSDGLICDMGISGSGTGVNIFAKYLNIFYPRIHDDNSGIANSTSSLGLFLSNRTTSTEIRAFQNNSLKLITSNSVSKVSNIITLAVLNGATKFFYSNRQYAFASIGDGLSDTEAGNFYTAVQAFQTTLSRQV